MFRWYSLLTQFSPACSDRTPEATQQEMEDAQLPLATRDACAHYLIRLNRCRFETYYLPWKCSAKREAYMRCLGQECVKAPRERFFFFFFWAVC
jgi:NADH dehydrogenase (ubiquinone) 1 beta subcomplex subunit 7